ncbi:hypothetical protein KL910_001138 [Ogataea haglerorum]|nr:hypothetical protein KL945_003905 [Ogataea haglerorum]KAG7791757.1 hypothetical protein KL910_001138 [Ogataea haglerorum]
MDSLLDRSSQCGALVTATLAPQLASILVSLLSSTIMSSSTSIVHLEEIDLRLFDEGPEARQALAERLEKALTGHGFFQLVNHGLVTDHLASIGSQVFEEPDEVKAGHIAGENDLPEESYKHLGVVRGSGYKPRGYWTYINDQKDRVEFFNLRHFAHPEFVKAASYPPSVEKNLPAIITYFNELHQNVLRKLLSLIDIILELPDGTLYNNHFRVVENKIKESATGYGRFLLYHEADDSYNMKTGSTLLRGHTDASALTFILSDPVKALQIRLPDTDNTWGFVKHKQGALVVNVGDALQFWTGDYFRSSVHRVASPPKHQKRSSIIYFCTPTSATYLDPDSLNSPKLKRLGIYADKSLQRITQGEWDIAKGAFFNNVSSNQTKGITILGRKSLGSLIGETVDT